MVIPSRWRHGGDHYEWLTAFLAARDLQVATCRVVAWIIGSLGAVSVLVIVASTGSGQSYRPAIAGLLFVACAVMAFLWLRSDWPSRRQSQSCLILGTALISAVCLLEPDPVLGLLSSSAFTVTTAYAVFFHSRMWLVPIWAVQTVTLLVLAWRLVEIDYALALAGVVFVALITSFVAFACELVLRIVGSEKPHGEIEPLTGLPNRQSFYDSVATLIGSRSRRDDRYLILIVVNLDSFSLLTAMSGKAGGNKARVAIGQRLRETVRGDAVIGALGEAEYLVADVFTTPDPTPLAERILGTIKSAPFRLTASLGVISTPLKPLTGQGSHDVLDELVTIGTNAMYEARKSGGNQMRLLLSPALATVEDAAPEDGPDVGRSA
ncbi:GGDEF domain-containing protein [Mycolicibacterium frederiksbergense]|uniref:GGDEF domain-containing protein n=1 Tax=Mycolicibacterium frederiksbergense TaxID=117567 RepID=UPI00265BA85A|nr:GGDEF domain-containing protein [Mycolicibacterium frederiksbergense]MDO0974086.1 GGDEF domain-containing protein [Mycolicibacterium frederiksbergense]